MKAKEPYRHAKKTTFKHDTIHIDNAGAIVARMKRKAIKMGLPASTPVSQLARIAIMAWITNAVPANDEAKS